MHKRRTYPRRPNLGYFGTKARLGSKRNCCCLLLLLMHLILFFVFVLARRQQLAAAAEPSFLPLELPSKAFAKV